MNDILIKIDTKTAKAHCEYNKIGVQHANLQNKLIFEMSEKIEGSAWLEYEIDGNKNYAVMEEIESGYQIDIKSCLLISNYVNIDLKITESENADGIPIFISTIVELDVDESINATEEEPEYYPDWKTVADSKIAEMNQLKEEIEAAIEETNNLDLDISKEGKIATVTLTKKDATTKFITLSDGTSLMFNWDGTRLGIKTDEDEEYTYVDLQGVQGPIGPQGEAFQIKKTYSTVAEMTADFNNMQLGDYVMIASTVETEDNAKLYTRGESRWIFISDFSGAQGIKGETGATPNIQIGTVASGATPSVTRTGTNENPILNFILQKGDTGSTGPQGETGATGNGIVSIIKTSTSGLVDTYTITYTDGTTSTFEVTNGEDGEVTQTQLDALQREIDYNAKYANALIKETVTGTELTINDTVECPMRMELKPSVSQQATTTGKNLFNPALLTQEENYNTYDSETGIWATSLRDSYSLSILYNAAGATSNRDITKLIKLQAGTYTIKFYDFINNSNVSTNPLQFALFDETGALISNISRGSEITTFTVDSDCYLDIRRYGLSGSFSFSKIQLEIGSTATDFEQYTGGRPAPNPSYPFDIHTISGNNDIKIENKNLFNRITATENRIPNWATGVNSSNNNSITSDFTKIFNITKFISSFRFVPFFYDKDGNYLGWGNELKKSAGTGASSKNSWEMPTNSEVYYCRFAFLTGGNNNMNMNEQDIMVENNTTAGIYEPHQEQLLPLNLGDLEYCKIGDYEDKFIKTSGKNLFNKDNASSGYYNLDGTLTSPSQTWSYILIDVSPSNNYVISGISTENANSGFIEFDSSKNFIQVGSTYKNGTFKTTSNTKYLGVSCRNADLDNFQLEIGTIATPHEPYGSGQWYLKKNIGKHIINNTDISQISSYWFDRYGLYGAGILKSKLGLPSAIINRQSLCTVSRKINSVDNDSKNTYLFNANANYIYFMSDEFDTIENANAKLVGAIIYYNIDTPEYILLNNTLQEELNNIYKFVLSYQDQTNISQVNNDLPIIFSATKIKDFNKLINNLTSRIEALENDGEV